MGIHGSMLASTSLSSGCAKLCRTNWAIWGLASAEALGLACCSRMKKGLPTARKHHDFRVFLQKLGCSPFFIFFTSQVPNISASLQGLQGIHRPQLEFLLSISAHWATAFCFWVAAKRRDPVPRPHPWGPWFSCHFGIKFWRLRRRLHYKHYMVCRCL